MTMRPRCPRTAGFSLVEVLIAIVILGIAAAGLGRLMLNAAQSGRHAGAIGYRTAVLAAEVNRVAAAPMGSLVDGATTTTVTTQPFAYTMTTVIATSGAIKTITITVTPTGGDPIPAVTRTMQRTLTVPNPFPGP